MSTELEALRDLIGIASIDSGAYREDCDTITEHKGRLQAILSRMERLEAVAKAGQVFHDGVHILAGEGGLNWRMAAQELCQRYRDAIIPEGEVEGEA